MDPKEWAAFPTRFEAALLLFDPSTAAERRALEDTGAEALALGFSPAGTLLAAADQFQQERSGPARPRIHV